MNNCKTPLPSNIDGVSGHDEILHLWRKHYYELLNCVKKKTISLQLTKLSNNKDLVVTSAEVQSAILKIKDNKACGPDNITT